MQLHYHQFTECSSMQSSQSDSPSAASVCSTESSNPLRIYLKLKLSLVFRALMTLLLLLPFQIHPQMYKGKWPVSKQRKHSVLVYNGPGQNRCYLFSFHKKKRLPDSYRCVQCRIRGAHVRVEASAHRGPTSPKEKNQRS